ncbi:MAG: putative metal-binding motif-containing protein [Saprospiraceae bacterium]|nr:putative metal-binding motif-containing protein [Saprospiraceae bacterium]
MPRLTPANISVSGLPTSGVKVKQVLINGLSHTFPGDIDMLLQSPTATNLVLISDQGSSSSISNVNLVLQDGSPAIGASIVSGTFRPTVDTGSDTYPTPGPGTVTPPSIPTLSSFTGDFNGTWNLFVVDDATGDGGSITSWSIVFEYGAAVTGYSWSPNTFLNDATIANPQAIGATATTTYTVTTTSSAGCTNSAQVTLTVNPLPTATVSGGGTVCSTDPLPDVSFALTGTGPWDLTYNDGTNNFPITGIATSPYTIMNAPAGTYTVVSVSDFNCSGTGSGSVTVATTPATTWYEDFDGDNYGNPMVTQMACTPPPGYVADNADCDDTDGDINPTTVWYKDEDTDGYSDGTTLTQCTQPTDYYLAGDLTATSGDCDDTDGDINPTTVWYKDEDGDGYSDGTTLTQCTQPTNYYLAGDLTAITGDCDDANPAIKPGATEVCDGIDNNCDGNTDEGLAFVNYYLDGDNDGYGDNNGAPYNACASPGPLWITDNTDCDDSNNTVYPGAAEICDNLDNDCDGMTDEGVQTTYYLDADGDNYYTGSPVMACTSPGMDYVTSVIGGGDCDDDNSAVNPGANEIVNGIDDNCNGQTDETGITYYRDVDGDGYGDPNDSVLAGSPPPGYVLDNTDCNDNDPLEKPGQTWYADTDNDGYSNGITQVSCPRPVGYKVAGELTQTTGDCNDANAAIKPGATEVCDGIDNNCNGMTDEGVLTTYFQDLDGDGFGNPFVSTQSCMTPANYVTNNQDCDDSDPLEKPGQTWYADLDNDGYSNGITQVSCLRPMGYKLAGELTQTTGDCNDNNAAIKPGAMEICDGIDNNCDGMTDEGVLTTYYLDSDSDGYYTGSPVIACSPPSPAYVTVVTGGGDCNDNNFNIKPSATEVCDGVDNDCDGMTDEGVFLTFYLDADGDGYYTGSPVVACSAPGSGYVLSVIGGGDCDDSDPLEKPGQTWYADLDNDGYSSGVTQVSCLRPGGYKVAGELTSTSTDCNDNNFNIKPSAPEICDGVDNDCDGLTDEGVLTTYYLDADSDGYYTGSPVIACSPPSPAYVTVVTGGGDCNDNNFNINPSATEICDGVDNDCDGLTDEGVLLTFYLDADGDGYYTGSPVVACSAPGPGYVLSVIGGGDCDDSDPLEKPGQTWYADLDNDGYSSGVTRSCLRPAGYKVAGELTRPAATATTITSISNPVRRKFAMGWTTTATV